MPTFYQQPTSKPESIIEKLNRNEIPFGSTWNFIFQGNRGYSWDTVIRFQRNFEERVRFIAKRAASHLVRTTRGNNAFHPVCWHMADILDRLLVRAWKSGMELAGMKLKTRRSRESKRLVPEWIYVYRSFLYSGISICTYKCTVLCKH